MEYFFVSLDNTGEATAQFCSFATIEEAAHVFFDLEKHRPDEMHFAFFKEENITPKRFVECSFNIDLVPLY